MVLRLHETGGKRHDVIAHHKAESHLDAAGIRSEGTTPLIRSIPRHSTEVSVKPLSREGRAVDGLSAVEGSRPRHSCL